jgi:hypothetical protein
LIIKSKIIAFKVRRLYIIAIALNCLLLQEVWAQNESEIRTGIESGSQKKLAKADQINEEADNLMEDVNRINMQSLFLQVDTVTPEESINKKSKQLEEQAWEKQIQASALYEKCNELKFTVYKKYIDEFWEKNPNSESTHLNEKLLEEQATETYFQAANYRIDAKRMDAGKSKVEKLADANNLELDAINKILTAISGCYGLHGTVENSASVPETAGAGQEVKSPLTVNIPVEDTSSARIQVNQEMIDVYNRYMSEGEYTDTTLSTGYLTGVTSFDGDRILQLWDDYLNRGSEPDISLPVPDTKLNLAVKTDQPSKQAEPQVAEIGIVTDENKGNLIPADEEIIYRVQIAAHRSELTQRALSRIYYGNKNVSMINENGWFKYSVGDFSTYEEASKFRKSSGIENSFVVAYRKGKPIAPEIPVAVTDTAKSNVPTVITIVPPGLIFRIQIAACHVPLTLNQLHRIYGGTYPVEVVEEDGWYKYQFMGVRLYSDARRILNEVQSKGAFVIAYENGARQSLTESVNKNKELEKNVLSHGRKGSLQETEFHVQLAATKIAMSPEDLKKLYNGPEKISVIIEAGWYKYHLKAGNSLEAARVLLNKSGNNTAFIVAYRRASKTELYDAIHEAR